MFLVQSDKSQGSGDSVSRKKKPNVATGRLVTVTTYRVALRMLMRLALVLPFSYNASFDLQTLALCENKRRQARQKSIGG